MTKTCKASHVLHIDCMVNKRTAHKWSPPSKAFRPARHKALEPVDVRPRGPATALVYELARLAVPASEIGDLAGVSPATVHAWMAGGSMPDPFETQRLADVITMWGDQ